LLPLADAKALADATGVPLGELRFLAFNRKVASVNHYQRFTTKKSGGERLISASMPRLKRAQHWVLDSILVRVPLHDAAHGFAPQRSILTNARNHVGRDVVINLDLKDFFPTLSYARIKVCSRRWAMLKRSRSRSRCCAPSLLSTRCRSTASATSSPTARGCCRRARRPARRSQT
jgi:hypothetical protein